MEDWQKILQVRSVVLSAQEDIKARLKFASLCRKNGRLKLSYKTLVNLLGVEPDIKKSLPTHCPQITYAFAKHLWASGERETALWYRIFF